MYVVTFAEPLADGTYDVRHLRRMSLLEAQGLADWAWPRRGTVLLVLNDHGEEPPERVS